MAGECPSCREAVSELTRSEISVATVLRKVCGVTQSRPVSGGSDAADQLGAVPRDQGLGVVLPVAVVPERLGRWGYAGDHAAWQ